MAGTWRIGPHGRRDDQQLVHILKTFGSFPGFAGPRIGPGSRHLKDQVPVRIALGDSPFLRSTEDEVLARAQLQAKSRPGP